METGIRCGGEEPIRTLVGSVGCFFLFHSSLLIPPYVGLYIGWRCPHYLWDCFRIGDESRCFCGHLLKEHQIISGRKEVARLVKDGGVTVAFDVLEGETEMKADQGGSAEGEQVLPGAGLMPCLAFPFSQICRCPAA